MSITRSQIARQLYQTGGDVDDVNQFIDSSPQGITNIDIDKITGPIPGIISGAANAIRTVKEGIGSVNPISAGLALTGILKSIDRFDELSPEDQAFITSQGLGQDKYGYNIRSALGNYAQLVRRKAQESKSKEMREYYQNLLQQQEEAKQMAAEKQRLEMMYGSRADDPRTTGGSSRDDATGGTFGSSVDDASTFSDYS